MDSCRAGDRRSVAAEAPVGVERRQCACEPHQPSRSPAHTSSRCTVPRRILLDALRQTATRHSSSADTSANYELCRPVSVSDSYSSENKYLHGSRWSSRSSWNSGGYSESVSFETPRARPLLGGSARLVLARERRCGSMRASPSTCVPSPTCATAEPIASPRGNRARLTPSGAPTAECSSWRTHAAPPYSTCCATQRAQRRGAHAAAPQRDR